jgi:hypothetical protein
MGELGNSQLVTIGTSLDHCHVPGREAFESVADGACVIGMGIHNEPVSSSHYMWEERLTNTGPPHNLPNAITRRDHQRDAQLPPRS